jgi:deazaflavin-dependent oxidoreductase (nitroreductase family)
MPIPLSVTRFNARVLNKGMVHLVGHLDLVELEHVGRKTGQVRRTPIMAFRDGDEVTVALTYGPEVQWLKNITAAGGARMRFGREWLALGPPRRLSSDDGLARMPQPQRSALAHLIHCRDYVAFPVVDERDADPAS